jgi:hypothetical protein
MKNQENEGKPSDATPLTDAEAVYGADYRMSHSCEFVVDADFTRDLERKLNAANARIAELEKDKTRLDALELWRKILNQHCGSSYGWEVVRSHNVNRIMVRSPYVCEPQAIDVNDFAHGGKDIRAAIDEAVSR